jgi:hypothetical protein
MAIDRRTFVQASAALIGTLTWFGAAKRGHGIRGYREKACIVTHS